MQYIYIYKLYLWNTIKYQLETYLPLGITSLIGSLTGTEPMNDDIIWLGEVIDIAGGW